MTLSDNIKIGFSNEGTGHWIKEKAHQQRDNLIWLLPNSTIYRKLGHKYV